MKKYKLSIKRNTHWYRIRETFDTLNEAIQFVESKKDNSWYRIFHYETEKDCRMAAVIVDTEVFSHE